MNPSERWAGDFGDAYTERNRVQWKDRAFFWRKMLTEMGDVSSILEVGVNAGWNGLALREAGYQGRYVGVDVNDTALDEARSHGFDVRKCAAVDLLHEFPTELFDLVFTSGVLIHVADSELFTVVHAIRDLSRKWVICVEYDSPYQVEVEYRGNAGMLWRRPYREIYRSIGMHQIIEGEAMGFDRCEFGVLHK